MAEVDEKALANLLEALQDPKKKALIIKGLRENGHFPPPSSTKTKKTPLKTLKAMRREHCESPTALHRKRALEELRQGSASSENANEASSDGQSESSTEVIGPKLPYEKLLKGVTAFVEYKRDGKDQSAKIKLMMTSMGAKVRDKFTRDVTHVIFKDGSFSTYQKAKLLKVHLVSVLWLEAVRRHGARVSESKYPALGQGTCEEDVSILCSQVIKDYEEIVQEEKRRSFVIPSSQKLADKDKRKTIMPRIISSDGSFYSAQSAKNDQPTAEDMEVAQICDASARLRPASPETTSDSDSDCAVVNGHSFSSTRRALILQSPTITDDLNNSKNESISKSESSNVSKSLVSGITLLTTNAKLHQDMELTCLEEQHVPISKETSSNDSDRTASGLLSEKTSTTMSSLRISSESAALGKSSQHGGKKSTEMSSLRISNQTNNNGDDVESAMQTRNLPSSTPKNSGIDENQAPNSTKSKSKPIQTTDDYITPNKRKSLQKIDTNKSARTVKKRKSQPKINDNFEPKSPLKSRKKTRTNQKTAPGSKTRKKTPNSDADSAESGKMSVMKRLGTESSKSSSSGSKTRSRRKLYNPDDAVPNLGTADNDTEREERVREMRQKGGASVFVHPKNASKPRSSAMKLVFEPEQPASDESMLGESIFEVSPPKKGRKAAEESGASSTSDEQSELLHYLKKRTRVSQRISQTPRINYSMASTPSTDSGELLPITPMNRRSTLEFQNLTNTQKMRQLKLDRKKQTSVVCTWFHKNEVNEFMAIVKELGEFFIEDNVSSYTTHVVAAQPKRTINMLKGIARGCWILKHEWLLQSSEKGKWLPEEDFELTEFSPAVQRCRLERHAFGSDFSMDLFGKCGAIYVAKETKPKQKDLKDLITLCKGILTTSERTAKISIGQYLNTDNVVCVSEQWVLDSITNYKLKNTKPYLIRPPDSPDY